MNYEVYTRICVGAPLEVAAARDLVARFHQSLGLDPGAKLPAVHARLREDVALHKQHEADRVRYERAFEAFVDGLWDVDCAYGGLSDGGMDPERGYIFVGVRVEDIEGTARDDMPAAAARPRWLKKGDLSMGSDLSRELGKDAHKQFRHAAQMLRRAGLQILGDAKIRVARLPVSRQHEPTWALVRWLVPVHETK